MATTKRMTEARAIEAALQLARGHYQRAIVLGRARLSGADLQGTARKYGGRYKASREALLARARAAKIPYEIRTVAHGKLVLAWGGEVR